MKKKSALRKTFLMVCALAFVLLVILFFFGSCTTQQKVVTKTTQPVIPEQVVKVKPIIWRQVYFKNLSVKDSILFYNSTEIRLEGEFFNSSFYISNGVLNVIDSINSVLKIVPQETPGAVIDLKKDRNGNINVMVVSFSRDEVTYNFSFFRSNDGSYLLSGKANLFFAGHMYPVTASTVGGNCLLLFYLNKKEVKSTTKDIAPGWQLENTY